MTEGAEKFPVMQLRRGQLLRLRLYSLPCILPLQRIPGLSRRMYSEQIPACIEHQKVFHGKAVCKMHHQKGQNIILRRDLRIEDCILQFFKPRKSFQMVILISGASGQAEGLVYIRVCHGIQQMSRRTLLGKPLCNGTVYRLGLFRLRG